MLYFLFYMRFTWLLVFLNQPLLVIIQHNIDVMNKKFCFEDYF